MGNGAAALAVDSGHPVDRGASSERVLFRRHREQEDEGAREQLVARYMPLAQRLARRYSWGREPVDDLIQVAFLGLVKAVDRFDPERGVAFTSYAVPTIVGELKRYLRDATWSVHVSQRMRQRVLEVSRAADDLQARLGRSPTGEEIAQESGEDVAYVAEAVEAASAYDSVSLEWGMAAASEDTRFDTIEYGAVLEPALSALPPRERAILSMRFDLDLTQSEIASTLGMSQMHVSRLLRRSLDRLRAVAARTACE